MSSKNRKINFVGLSFIFILIVFASLMVLAVIGDTPVSIELYVKIYAYVLLFYLWYRFALLFAHDLKKQKPAELYESPVSVIIPAFNEDHNTLRNCLNSVTQSYGEKEIILVNDGSDEPHTKSMEHLSKELDIKLVSYKINQGKRYAQMEGLKYAQYPIIITMDSDTIVKYDSFRELIKPFADHSVGAVTGQILVSNKDENILTKMVHARYWSAFNIERKGLSAFSVVNCCSGPLSAYRAETLVSLADIYLSQSFLGTTCTYGDDRHLTNLFLEKGYKVVYQETAFAYTESPTTIKKLVKQQIRWKRSFLRESLYTLTYSFNRSKLLFFDTLFNLLLPFFAVFARIISIVFIILFPQLILLFIASVVLVSFVRNLPLFMYNWRLGSYSVYYAFIHEFIIYWLFFGAVFTIKEKSWGTR